MSQPQRFQRFQTVGSFARVLPYVWPYRRKVLLSFLFAGLVAVFWSVNLSIAFPVIKVLVQGETLESYVNAEIKAAEKEISQRKASLQHYETLLQQHEAEPHETTGDRRGVEILKDRTRQQSKLSAAGRKLLVMEWMRSNVVPVLPGDQFDLLALIFGFTMLAVIIKGLCVFAQDVLIGNVVELTSMSLRKHCFRRTLALDYQTLHLAGSADLMSRFTHDLHLLGYGLRLLGGKVIREPLKAACCIVGAMLVCWQLTLLSLLAAPIAAAVFYRLGRRLKQASRRMMESMSRIYKMLEETFDAMKVVIAFNGAPHHRRRFHRESKEYYRKSQKIVTIDAITSPATEVLGMFTAFLALLPGAYLVLRGTTRIWGITLSSHQIDIAELSLLYVLLAGVIDPMRKLSTTYAKLKRGSAAAERIFSLVDKQPLVREPEHPQPMPRHREAIEFRRIEFRYAQPDHDGLVRPPVLDDVTLTVEAGEAVVVVGENGCGKSTFVNLLPRYFDPDHGEVLIDGVDVRTVRLRDLREQIAVVTQETLLFDGSIYENIHYGKPGATPEEVHEAARLAYVADFLTQLPDGIATEIGEKGNRLSGGQRQRIALARAILRDPAILILDEATSAIDAQSEQLIHRTLRNFVQGRTTFIITHSVSQSMLDFVTRIVVMQDGKIVSTGSHAELIADCPTYRRLFHSHVQQRTAGAGESAGRRLSIDGHPAPEPGEPPLPQRRTDLPHKVPVRGSSPNSAPEAASLEPQHNPR